MSDADHRDSDRRADRKRELISQEAAEWFARMKDPRVPLDDRRRFLRWLKQSQVHVAEYLTVAGIDGDLRRGQGGLVRRGEAYFKVAPDATRPFVVEAHAFAVRALGTEFAVSNRKDELIVTVSEG